MLKGAAAAAAHCRISATAVAVAVVRLMLVVVVTDLRRACCRHLASLAQRRYHSHSM
jgi:hypothetical protein